MKIEGGDRGVQIVFCDCSVVRKPRATFTDHVYVHVPVHVRVHFFCVFRARCVSRALFLCAHNVTHMHSYFRTLYETREGLHDLKRRTMSLRDVRNRYITCLAESGCNTTQIQTIILSHGNERIRSV